MNLPINKRKERVLKYLNSRIMSSPRRMYHMIDKHKLILEKTIGSNVRKIEVGVLQMKEGQKVRRKESRDSSRGLNL
ncbi:hypothetical protein N665_0303s0034 [Sinapis alba]|nr:hypothetical protein N665_0303s0034 [Sinapis alba]KAF8096711.1 hypothetical protein N665_0303s0034 [Sinapis alba]